EVCNGIDDDCDGMVDAVDDGLVDGIAAFADDDGDGFGDPDSPVRTCALGDGAVEDATDCDDGAPTTNPAAPEQCGTIVDDDCDGDDNDAGAAGCIDLYEDVDGDGFGGDGTACLCRPDADYPAYFSRDCDDTDASVNPDAAEVCGNGLDDDCDGTPGVCPLMGTLSLDDAGDATVAGLEEDAETGTRVLAPGDVDGDGRDDVAVLAPGGAGAVGVVRGGWTGSLPLDDGDGLLLGTNGFDSIAAVGDIDGDGAPDLAVGSLDASSGAGAVWVWTTPLAGTAAVGALSIRRDGQAGWAAGLVGGGGDVDADGHADLLVAAPDEGDVFLVRGPVTAAASLSTRGVEIRGAGSGVAEVDILGDMNGDGLDDVVVGSPTRSSSGRAWILHGPVTAVPSMNEADVTLSGVAAE
ncbi:MAG: MopE-related protein, partial [Myxococcota bacterium]|nr:MopE-related protein [Myxococcota bacterium]